MVSRLGLATILLAKLQVREQGNIGSRIVQFHCNHRVFSHAAERRRGIQSYHRQILQTVKLVLCYVLPIQVRRSY
jgi:hypothetical protein